MCRLSFILFAIIFCAAQPAAAYLHALADPLRRVLRVNFVHLIDFVHWVGALPLETAGVR